MEGGKILRVLPVDKELKSTINSWEKRIRLFQARNLLIDCPNFHNWYKSAKRNHRLKFKVLLKWRNDYTNSLEDVRNSTESVSMCLLYPYLFCEESETCIYFLEIKVLLKRSKCGNLCEKFPQFSWNLLNAICDCEFYKTFGVLQQVLCGGFTRVTLLS